MDVFTLFAANAIILLVMAGGFTAVWVRQRSEAYWLSWISGNLALAMALLLFMVPTQSALWADVLPHTLLVAGFALRWRAARQFSGQPASWRVIGAPVAGTILLFSFPGLFSAGITFLCVNVLLAGQTAAIAYTFWRDRDEPTPSSYGLVLAYGAMAASFLARVGQGAAFTQDFTSYLPHDGMLQIHLLVAIVHTCASGAFALSIALERAASHLRQEHETVQAEARRLEKLAKFDGLTGLMNRRALESRFDELRQAGFETVAIVDLDRFKSINDRYGHSTGDQVLRAAASALAPDTNCVAARLGGEEFMLLLRGRKARQRAEQRRQEIPLKVGADVPGLDRVLTASMGLVELPCHGTAKGEFHDLYCAADRLLYEAKRNGRDQTAAEKLAILAPTPDLERQRSRAA